MPVLKVVQIFFYQMINTPSRNCAIIFNLAYFPCWSKSQVSCNLLNPLLQYVWWPKVAFQYPISQKKMLGSQIVKLPGILLMAFHGIVHIKCTIMRNVFKTQVFTN